MNVDHVPKTQQTTAFHALRLELERLEKRVSDLEGERLGPLPVPQRCAGTMHVFVLGRGGCQCGQYPPPSTTGPH